MKLTFLGDILCDYNMSTVINNYYDEKEGKYNFSSILSHGGGLKQLLKASDYVFANLETPVSYDNSDLTNQQWQFNSPYEFAEAVKECGVDFVSTANNHCLDRGLDGLSSTIKALDELKLEHCGTYAKGTKRKPLIINIQNKRIGVLAYTYGTNAVTNNSALGFKNRRLVDLLQEQEGTIDSFLSNKPKLIEKAFRKVYENKYEIENIGKEWFEKTTFDNYRKRLIKKDIKYFRRKKVDLIVAYAHVGGQYNSEPNSHTLRTVDFLLDNGVNIVIANHEHVIHGSVSTLKNNQVAAYALGNLLGSAGTYREPNDKRSQYSIALHTYIDSETNCIEKATFSVIKTVVDKNDKYTVWPVIDLLKHLSDEEKKKTIEEAILAAKDFSGREFNAVEAEFVLFKR